MESTSGFNIGNIASKIGVLFLLLYASFAYALVIPQHLFDVWWDCGYQKDPVSKVKIDFSLNSPGDFSYVYIAPLGKISIGGIDMYGGVQSNIYGWTSIYDKTIKHYGSGAIFSRWAQTGNNKLTVDDLILTEKSIVEIGSYEGQFASVRKEIPIENGTYSFILDFVRDQVTYANAKIVEPNGKEVKIGGFILPKNSGIMNRYMASFLEIYSSNYKIPNAFQIEFRPPVVDNITCKFTNNSIVTPKYAGSNLSNSFKYIVLDDRIRVLCCKN